VTQRGREVATTAFARGPRLAPPVFADGDIPVAAPPIVPRAEPAGALARLLPVLTLVAMAGMVAVTYASGAAATRSPMFLLFPVMMLASVSASIVHGRAGQRAAEVSQGRRGYLAYLAALTDSASETAAAQRASLLWCHPDTESLWTLTGGPRMWERRSADSDFGHVRVGVGTQRLATRLLAPAIGPVEELDPVTAMALRRFIRAHATVPEVPIAIALRGMAAVTVDGDARHARALLRAMVCQAAVLHGPQQLLIAAAVSDDSRGHWDWLKWLPHHQHPSLADAAGPARLTYRSLAAAETALATLLTANAESHAVVVVDRRDRAVTEARSDRLTMLEVGTSCDPVAAAHGLRLSVTAEYLAIKHPDDDEVFARPDRMTLVDAVVCARRLARFRPGRADAEANRRGAAPQWRALLGVTDPGAITPEVAWRPRGGRERLRVPIGTTPQGAPVDLDIKEAAEEGIGPHGLCVGATGSGKSELLRTVVLGMIARHSPEDLNLVLVDFKGGATFLGLDGMRHIAAVITNLADEAHLVARMKDALSGEMNRRQQLLRAAGNMASVADYQRVRRGGAALTALPSLFIIVDEFSELLSQHPDFAEVFVAVGRLGRSLGMHLLLASQRMDEGRLRGLESHLSYRICLKTLSANESRMVLGAPDAYHLPSTPGAAYLKTGTDDLIRFQTTFVSAPYRPEVPADRSLVGTAAVQLFTAATARGSAAAPAAVGDRTIMQTVLDRLANHGPRAHEVWLPPLNTSPALTAVLGEPGANLTAAIGLVDRPFEQRRTPLVVDISAAAGNVAVVGGPQSGKSTTLRTLITALALTHEPRLIQFYCLDFGGGALASVRPYPHVGAVAARHEAELVRRIVGELESTVWSRELAFRERGITSMADYRRRRAAGDDDLSADPYGDVLLVVDGWAALRQEFDALEAAITALAAQGLSFGVHVVVSASRWADIRPALRDQLGTRIELRLGDPADSELDRKQARNVPAARPGRGLTADGRHMLIALPSADAAAVLESSGYAAPPIRLLPAHVDYDAVVREADDHIAVGVGERGLRTVTVNFDAQPHLLILGDTECGKTTVLRTLCREIARTHTAEQATVFLVDFRRTLMDVVDPDHLGGYVVSAIALDAQLPSLLGRLRARLPGAHVSRAQLRARSWWSGPKVFLVVDDYELVATASGNPLALLAELLPHAKDLGLHLVVARRSGGAARAMFEPLLTQVRDLGAMGLVMSADPDEGPLFGAFRASRQPPGRGTLLTRADIDQVIQVAWSPPT
jgi:S-DNA-T family DNA segregation ATPase FtsK/SpoIIIE